MTAFGAAWFAVSGAGQVVSRPASKPGGGSMLLTMVSPRPHRVIVVGGGFGGLQAATHLTTAPVELTLVDRRNFHLFQPLTYQVATGALSPGEVCYPLRAIFRRHQNVQVVLGEVAGFDLDRRRLDVRPVVGEGVTRSLEYDTLIVAGGSHYSYFGHDEWRDAAPEVKSLESAVAVRARLLAAFEAAELDDDEARRRAWLTFVVVGAGPTGVEMAGQIAELARDTLRRDFRSIDPRHARVLLVEAADRVLTAFPPSLSRRTALQLEHLGVTPALERTVVGVDEQGVTVVAPGGEQERFESRTVIWAAGVTASGLARRLAELTGAELDRAGRIAVEPDLTLPGHPEVLALGDMVRVRDARESRRSSPAWRPSPCSRAGTPPRSSAPGCATGRIGRSATATRATSQPSVALARWRTCTWSASAASRRGSRGSSSISSTLSASRTVCSCSSAGRSAS